MSMNAVLGLDLILEVLDCLCVPIHFHQRACDLPVLTACSLVCKEWSPHAQRLLFRRVILPNNIYSHPHSRGGAQNPLPSFLVAIDTDTERGRWLAESVLSFTLRHTGRSLTADSPALATALLRMPNLRHLDVTTIFCDFDSETLLRLRTSGPRLTSLAITQDFSPSVGQHTRIMHRLVSLFPTLKILEITSELKSELAPFDPPPNLALECAKFNTAIAADISLCLASLLDPKAETPLQVLWHKSKAGHPSVLDGILATHGKHLRSIAFKSLDSEVCPPLHQCSILERFEYGRYPSADILAALPNTITALGISGFPEPVSRIDSLEAALLRLPRLRILTWSLCLAPFDFFVDQMCRRLGIQLRASATEVMDDNAVELELRRKYIRI
ncbi:hypothetical protein R3P38DRAFT_2937381 [Favolaschia claudopus]|uniref:F-box domain-containing protein n=1 Tax=Favolaschia claudopus TaxID=2862362 RepID=A0AAW0BQB8_9AGAR